MKVLHSIASLRLSDGGPSRSVTALCNHLGKLGATVKLLSVGKEFDSSHIVLPNPTYVSLHHAQELSVKFFGVRYSPFFASQIYRLYKTDGFNIIHDHGLWLPNNYSSSKIAHKLKIPFIVSTRGMLEPWALKYRCWKKKPMWLAWQKGAICSAAVLHATATAEADNLRALGLTNPIAIIPNGVDCPDLSERQCCESKIALFLSRIHPGKGLMNLVETWAKIRPKGWRMVVAGPDEVNHTSEVKKAVEKAGISGFFDFLGPVNDTEKWDLYSKADLFILPSFSENFGIVIAEALAAGVPVITTKSTPWGDLEDHCCGWWVDIGVKPLSDAFLKAIELSDTELSNMGKRGRNFVRKNYSWEKIASDMLEVYKWVQYGGVSPDCLRLH